MTHEILFEEEDSLNKICQVFFEALQRKKRRDSKKKSYQNMQKRKNFEDIHQQGNWKKVRFFVTNRQERFPFFYRNLQTAKKQRKVNEKRRNRLIRKKKKHHTKKRENTRMEKHTENNEKGGKE